MYVSVLLFVTICPALVYAGFNADNLEGLYRLKAGIDDAPRCASLLTFSSSGTDIPAADILLDKIQCSGGNMVLVKNPRSGGTGFVRHFFFNPASGDFYGAQLTAKLKCGETTSWGETTYLVFVQPDEDITITWEDVAGLDTPLEAVTASVYTFEKGLPYIIVNNRCLYIRDDNPSQVNIDDVDDDSMCFPADATVLRDDGKHVLMSELETGERVAIGGGRFSAVFTWTHRDTNAVANRYVSIDAGLERRLTLTPSHFVHASGRTIAAAAVRPGDVMTTENGSSVVVGDVRTVKSKGLFNPQTVHGDIVVDGLVVSTYTCSVEQSVAHALLAPVRAAFRCTGKAVGEAVSSLVDTGLFVFGRMHS